MFTYWFTRINNKHLYLSLLIGFSICFLQLVFSVMSASHSLHTADSFFSPYTKWIGIDLVSSFKTMYYFLLPIIATIGVGNIIQQDKNNGFLYISLSKTTKQKYFTTFFLTSFLTGFIVITLPLLFDFLAAFLFLPNVPVNPIINSNIGLTETSTFFPDLYFSHPFIHVLFYIVLAGFFGGIFSLLSVSCSFYYNNQFSVLIIGFIIQIVLTIMNLFISFPISPMFFLPEIQTIQNGSLLYITILAISLLSISSILFYQGVKKRVIF
ncbi:hypothetical protein ACQKFK_31700 [Bacillus mycoides]|uniref:hypothetical protein n=1 Tax=Bacillus mycoides TaxID=1405 RepID=UPI003CFCCBFF